METKKKMRNRLVGRILALTMAVCLLFSLAITAKAASKEVEDVATGVFKFDWYMGSEYIGSGTCFLINDEMVMTANHCVWPSKELVESVGLGGKNEDELTKIMKYEVTLQSDLRISATLLYHSEKMDFAILKLSQSVASNHKVVAFRGSSEVKAAENTYIVGFPGVSRGDGSYTTKDVTFTTGVVTKPEYRLSQDLAAARGLGVLHVDSTFLQINGEIKGGNSGGPVVDENGNVIGVVSWGHTADNYNYCSASSQIMSSMDELGVKYQNAGLTPKIDEPTDPVQEALDTKELSDLISEAEEIDEQDYTEDSYKDLKKALKDAKSALSATTQSEIDDAASELEDAIDDLEKAEKKSPLSQYAIIGIIAFVVLVIAGVVILLVVLSKKNSKQQATVPVAKQGPATAPAASSAVKQTVQQQPVQQRQVAPTSSETTVLNQGAGETTVLAQGAGETTVLAQNVNGGSLVRSSNNESIPICSAEFTVGRERRSVDYCVGGNTNISRVHARFVVRDGKTYIVDNKAANGTFVNGVKARPGQEIELKDGDKILLADEKFEYKK